MEEQIDCELRMKSKAYFFVLAIILTYQIVGVLEEYDIVSLNKNSFRQRKMLRLLKLVSHVIDGVGHAYRPGVLYNRVFQVLLKGTFQQPRM